MSFCICCGAENINGIHDHDPECLWYEPKMESRGLDKVMMGILEKNFPVIIEQSIKEYIGDAPLEPPPEMKKLFDSKKE
jgi:hypothetical protein